jgi:hypothetical protein
MMKGMAMKHTRSYNTITLADPKAIEHQIQGELERLGAASVDGCDGLDCLREDDGSLFLADSQEREDLEAGQAERYLAALKALPNEDPHESGFERAWRAFNEL